jgi:predicted RNA-binding Zn-ribbon protein involved in translation (DUF1610 family)
MGAFGKDRAGLKHVTNLREASNISRQKRTSKGGGGWMRFANQFKPSQINADTIRFIPGEYVFEQVKEEKDASGRQVLETEKVVLPYHCYTEHFDGRTNTSTICSAGPFAAYKGKSEPCCGCDIFWETGGKKGGRMSRRDMKVFTVLNYATFHEVEQVDQNGNFRMNDRTNKPYTNWVQCTGRKCDACLAQKPTKKGHVQHYSVGFGHFSQLKDYAKEIGKSCKSCGSKNSIEAVAYLCPNCKDAVIDMSTTQFTDEEINKMIDENIVCPHCRETVLLEEIVECKGCPNPERAGIFDVDISIKKVAGPDGTNQSTLLFTGYGEICPVDPVYEAKPMELPRMFEPDSIEKQADKFKVAVPSAVPRQPVPASNVSRPWGQGTGGGNTGGGSAPSGGGGMFGR